MYAVMIDEEHVLLLGDAEQVVIYEPFTVAIFLNRHEEVVGSFNLNEIKGFHITSK